MNTVASNTNLRYVLHISPDALQDDPELLELIKAAGVDEVAISSFLYGHWTFKPETTSYWMREAQGVGLEASVVNAPLGHPGDAMGSQTGSVPLAPPKHWKNYVTLDGEQLTGTSLHEPATEENVTAIQRILPSKPKIIWMDDDLRLASTPGMIGGCFCAEHKRMFLRKHAFGESKWNELLDAIHTRRMCPVLKHWVDMQCDLLTACFRAQQKAAGHVPVGNMIMRLGSEKAGIRLKDYANSPFRIGEEHFNDDSFGPVKGKTEELYSALFHRRYAKPHLAYSETTAYPADHLSAANMAAKLCVTTIADVRHTMFQSGMTAFPRTHWQTLAPAMKEQAATQTKIAGAKLQGPLKHYFGTNSRYVGHDDPYTLFLAIGIPFEVCDSAPKGGWVFVSTPDVPLAKEIGSKGAALICRPDAAAPGYRAVPESLPELMGLKHEIIDKMGLVPYVLQDLPVVCAWYPEIHKVLLWNLTEQRQELTLVYGELRRNVAINALGTALLEDV
ncbi:MAG: hypothetical protein ACYC1M_17590 [Armatimonadota bacterium]